MKLNPDLKNFNFANLENDPFLKDDLFNINYFDEYEANLKFEENKVEEKKDEKNINNDNIFDTFGLILNNYYYLFNNF